MPKPHICDIQLSRTLPRSTDVLVAGITDSGAVGLPSGIATALKKQYDADPSQVVSAMGSSTDPLTTTVVPLSGGRSVVFVRIPSDVVTDDADDGDTLEQLRRAAGAGTRAAAGLLGRSQHKTGNLAVGFGRVAPDAIRAVAEGALLGAYTFQPLGSPSEDDAGITGITVVAKTADKRQTAAAEAATAAARAVIANRDWVNRPANLLYPETFAQDACDHLKQLGNGTKIKTEIWDEKALTREGYGGLLGVGGGSHRPPRLLRMSYAPRGATFHLALVGKGITFDSGGLNLKPAAGMYTMKSDMSGAAAVIATIGAVAELGLKIKVTGYAAMAENMPSGSAYRPSDVLTMYGGKTVENANTDAEGRLVMADALVRATQDEPDLIVDVATLTGASITALGERTGGVLANDDTAADQVLTAAKSAGESFWQLPMAEGIREHLDSQVADVKSARSGPGGALTAAFFLREFVSDVPWAHLDIAGPSFHDGTPYGYVPAGGTGIGVRTLIRLAESASR